MPGHGIRRLGINGFQPAPAGKSGIQKGIGTVHSGLDADSFAVSHMQFYYNAAAGDHIQFLTENVTVAVSNVFFAKGGMHEGILIIKDSETQMVDAQANTQKQNQQTAVKENIAFGDAIDQGNRTQNGQENTGSAVDFGQPYGQTTAVLLFVAEIFLKTFVKKIADTEGGGCYQNENCHL